MKSSNKFTTLIVDIGEVKVQFRNSQARHGLAPECELINMHELIKKSTNNYVTLLPLENGINLNTKG